MTAISKCTSAYVETEIDGEAVLMSLSDGHFYSLRDSGLSIWNAVDGHRDREAVVATVAKEFGVEPDVVAADVREFLSSLSDAGLIAG